MTVLKDALWVTREALVRLDMIAAGLATGGMTFTYTVDHDDWCPTPIGDCNCTPDIRATAS